MAGWVKLAGNPDVIQAIKEAGVPSDGLVVNWQTWVPRWVKDAVTLYQKSGGYADMTLAQFLQKMRP